MSINSATLQLEQIHNKVLTDNSKKTPLTKEEKTFLAHLNLKNYSPLTKAEKLPFINLRRTHSLTKEEKACFTQLGIEKNPPLTKEERDYLIQATPSQQLSTDQKYYLISLRNNRLLSAEEKEHFKKIGIVKSPLTEDEKLQLAALTKKGRLTVREKGQLANLQKTKFLTAEEKKCFVALGMANEKSRLPENTMQALIKYSESKSIPLKKEEKECLTHLLESKSLTEKQITQLSQLNICSEKSLTKEEQIFLSGLVDVLASESKNEKVCHHSIPQDEIIPDFYVDEQPLDSSVSMGEQSEYMSSSSSMDEEEDLASSVSRDEMSLSSSIENNPTTQDEAKSVNISVLKEGIAQNFCTEEQKEALRTVFERHYDTAIAYSLGLTG
jgi:uncharacterized protein YifE (UPF0438 family)